MKSNHPDESAEASEQQELKRATLQLTHSLLVLLQGHPDVVVIPALFGVVGNRAANSEDPLKACGLAGMAGDATAKALHVIMGKLEAAQAEAERKRVTLE